MEQNNKAELLEAIDHVYAYFELIYSEYENNNGSFDFINELTDKLMITANCISNYNKAEIDLDDYNGKLINLLTAMEDKDMDYFFEIYRFEFKPLLEEWKEYLSN